MPPGNINSNGSEVSSNSWDDASWGVFLLQPPLGISGAVSTNRNQISKIGNSLFWKMSLAWLRRLLLRSEMLYPFYALLFVCFWSTGVYMGGYTLVFTHKYSSFCTHSEHESPLVASVRWFLEFSDWIKTRGWFNSAVYSPLLTTTTSSVPFGQCRFHPSKISAGDIPMSSDTTSSLF